MAAPHNPGRQLQRGHANVGAAARHQQQQRANSRRGIERHERAVQRAHRNGTPKATRAQRNAEQRRAAQQKDQERAGRRAQERSAARPERQARPTTTGLANQGRQGRDTRPGVDRRSANDHNFVAAPRQRGQRADNARRFALSNPSFAHASGRESLRLSRATFHGRFADARFRNGNWRHWHWRRHHPIVIGWIGPVFWPYAYADFVDYTYYPYAYDTFWPYAYDDLYVGIFGPYAYGSGVVTGSQPSGGSRRSSKTRGSRSTEALPPTGQAEVCSVPPNQLTDWPIERIADVVQPTAEQRAALDDLKNAAAKAMDVLQAACPDALPSTPPGRLQAMRARLEAMQQAVQIVRPPLETFYQSLSDEQKERFNSFGDEQDRRPNRNTSAQGPDLTKVCSGQAAAQPPVARIERALQPTNAQRAALGELDQASREAADILKANCPQDESLTPPGRLEAMEQRLDAMLKALATVQPALERFYGSLSDEQKARFNRIDRGQG
jgi:hypothetical protein